MSGILSILLIADTYRPNPDTNISIPVYSRLVKERTSGSSEISSNQTLISAFAVPKRGVAIQTKSEVPQVKGGEKNSSEH